MKIIKSERKGKTLTPSYEGKTKNESKEGRMGDALALGGEEGRDKLRKAAERGKYPLYPRMSEWGNPAGAIPSSCDECRRRTRGTETSKYPQEKKVNTIPRVEAIERGGAQTGRFSDLPGL